MKEKDMKKITNDNHIKTLHIAINYKGCPTSKTLNNFKNDDYIFINLKDKKIELSNSPLYIPIETDIVNIFNSNYLDNMSLKYVTAIFNNLKEYLLNYDIIYIVTHKIKKPLSIFLRLLASYFYKIGAITVLFVLEPFYFEGKLAVNDTKSGINKLKYYTDITVTISADCIAKELPKGTFVTTAIRIAESHLYQCVNNFNELIYNSGLKNVDFHSLSKILIDKEPNWLGIFSSMYINPDKSILGSVLTDIENDIQRDLSRTLKIESYGCGVRDLRK